VQAIHPHARHHQADAEHHRHPQARTRRQIRRHRCGLADQHDQLDHLGQSRHFSRRNPSIDGKGSHGGYCGPAVKPIALNMVAEIARDPETYGLPISGIGGITTWRDAAEFLVLGAGNVQVCTAAMTYGFKIVQEMITGLSNWMDAKGHRNLDDITGRAVPNVSDWQYLNLNYIAKAKIDQDACIKCGRCHIACEDTSHQAITQFVDGVRHFEVMEDECVGCNLCVNVCPVENCITMEQLEPANARRTHRQDRRSELRQLDDASEQPDGPPGRRVRFRQPPTNVLRYAPGLVPRRLRK
jgi:NAD-dependent dihydropyrimidine dehydrogenase PreA subunit